MVCTNEPAPPKPGLIYSTTIQPGGSGIVLLNVSLGIDFSDARFQFQPGGTGVYSNHPGGGEDPQTDHQRVSSPLGWVQSDPFNNASGVGNPMFSYDEVGIYDTILVIENLTVGGSDMGTSLVDLIASGDCAPSSDPASGDQAFTYFQTAGMSIQFDPVTTVPSDAAACPQTMDDMQHWYDPGDGSGMQFAWSGGFTHIYAAPGDYLVKHWAQNKYRGSFALTPYEEVITVAPA